MSSPDQAPAPDGRSGAEPGATEGQDSKGEAGREVIVPELTIDGMGKESDLTRLRGMDNPLEEVRWTYMSPPLEEEREPRPLKTAVFWSTGRPPKERDLEKEKELAKLIIPKPGDKDYCFLKYGDIPSPRPDYCFEHGWLTGPESFQPRRNPEIPERVLNCIHMVGIDKPCLAECSTHGELKINIVLEVEAVETVNQWDVRRETLTLPCGYGYQPLRWLGQATCIRLAFLRNEPPSKFLPLAVKSMNSFAFDPDMPIRDILSTGDKVIVDYSSGPDTFREPWLGRSAPPTPNTLIKEFFESLPKEHVVADIPPPKMPPPKKKKKKKEEAAPPVPGLDNPDATPAAPPEPQYLDQAVQTPVDIVTFLDWPAYDIPALLLRVMPNLDRIARETEFMVVQEIMKAYSGAIQALVLWFSGQGRELEDKDFGLLYLEQYMKLFRDMKMCPLPFSESRLTGLFTKYVEVNNLPGSYQLSSWGLFPILLHLASDAYDEAGPEACYHEKIYHFFVDDFLPNFNDVIKSTLEDFHSAETAETTEVMKERDETAKAALKAIIPEYTETLPIPISMDPNIPTPGIPDLSTPELKAAAVEEAMKKTDEEELSTLPKANKDKKEVRAEAIVFANAWAQVDIEVDAKTIIPYFKKWLALGENWDDSLAAGVIIFALQSTMDVMEFAERTATLRFGYQEIQRFLLAASHCIYKQTPLMRVSEHSFLRTYMQNVYYRAKVAQPLYTTYEEKLDYLRKQCFRHEEPLPQLPEKEKGFS